MNKQILDPFYLITDNNSLLEQLIPLGIKLVQLRIKNASAATLQQNIISAKNLCNKYNCQLIINDHWQLALEAGCDFIHLGQEDLANCDIAAIARSGIKLGVSTHSKQELQIALSLKTKGVNLAYIALGPVYETKLKKMPWPPQGIEKLTIWKKTIGNLPLVAIGGFTPQRALLALQAGADSIAVVTDISLHSDPKGRTLE
ncbi:MAG: thiamine phosphate synthase, partial [Alphaproteobacteria bacterium]|nr:thiamine phosphate synthase [Alphaproteobacteria bacterium]